MITASAQHCAIGSTHNNHASLTSAKLPKRWFFGACYGEASKATAARTRVRS